MINNTGIEVNLVENEQKDILLAPAIDEDAQKEAAHDSGASSTLIGFRDVYSDYKRQVIPIRTAGNTIYAAGIGSVGVLQNVIHVPNLQKQLLSISQICNQLNYAYLINGTKLEVINNANQEVVHTCYRNSGHPSYGFPKPRRQIPQTHPGPRASRNQQTLPAVLC